MGPRLNTSFSTVAIPDAKKIDPSIVYPFGFYSFFLVGPQIPQFDGLCAFKQLQYSAQHFLGSHLALKFLNFNEVASSTLTQRLDFIKKSSFFTFKFSKHFILMAFLLPPGLKKLISINSTSGNIILEIARMHLSRSKSARNPLKMDYNNPITLITLCCCCLHCPLHSSSNVLQQLRCSAAGTLVCSSYHSAIHWGGGPVRSISFHSKP